MIFLWGCAKQSLPLIPPESRPQVPVSEFIAGYSVKKRPVPCIIMGNGKESILLIASIHGDEIAGTPLTYRLRQHFFANPHLLAGRRIILLPAANPDGMASFARFNDRKVDLNRNFPSGNRKERRQSGEYPCSEPETKIIMRLIHTYRPVRIITLHEPMNCIDYDGPGDALAGFIADHCHLPVRKIGAMPGSLGSYAGEELGIPVITMELPKQAAVLDADALWGLYGNALLASVLYPEYPGYSLAETGRKEYPRPVMQGK